MPCPAKELGGIAPFVAMSNLRVTGKTFLAAWCVDGARVLGARSGTACRAPTVGKRLERRTRARWSQVLATEGIVTLTQCSFSRAAFRRTPVLLKGFSTLGESLVLG